MDKSKLDREYEMLKAHTKSIRLFAERMPQNLAMLDELDQFEICFNKIFTDRYIQDAKITDLEDTVRQLQVIADQQKLSRSQIQMTSVEQAANIKQLQ